MVSRYHFNLSGLIKRFHMQIKRRVWHTDQGSDTASTSFIEKVLSMKSDPGPGCFRRHVTGHWMLFPESKFIIINKLTYLSFNNYRTSFEAVWNANFGCKDDKCAVLNEVIFIGIKKLEGFQHELFF